ncbi:hypothetical protein SNE40_016988 [Patella caerulea]|uniref:Carboxypeptidase n=1 Tax=Patella caerulea TaxID=87958 RepID=A0AAN8PEX6_PATCE
MACIVLILVLFVSVHSTNAAVSEDEVTFLPGLDEQPPWRQYSGYLQASGTKKFHYWFFESARYLISDPVIMWLNGGPGCSSLLGLFTENGPFRVLPNKTLVYHPYSWNRIANMLYLESPAGVGMSYSDDKYYRTNDDETSVDNYLAILDFFNKYPEFKNNNFYITGESYGGIYIPTVSSLVIGNLDINFKGMAIGNAMENYDTNENAHLYLAYYHGLIGKDLWQDLINYCCNGTLKERCMFTLHQDQPHCKDTFNAAHAIVFEGDLNYFNIYNECHNSPYLKFDKNRGKYTTSAANWMFPSVKRFQKEAEFLRSLPIEKVRLTEACLDTSHVEDYLNSPEVRKAIHIPDFIPEWQPVSAVVSHSYVSVYPDMSKQHLQVLAAGKRTMLYNGDVDMACDFLGESWFVHDLKLTVVEPRKAWFYQAEDNTSQVGGFIKKYKNLDLVTVRGAGHLSPSDKPREVLQMLINFLNEEM